ncbi:hypothetical protein [Anabaena azotica]|uniref:Uncharacterized protein n=1 Tax=Anabaena azotica FACHB-119 TaxID=947527 RepID=A0ABR8DCX1_9NOST|nr:hypothetical protein [Anabaena azotica]MBD2504067.1 hypothetical protein [Anabaena azotica FACHB-119]
MTTTIPKLLSISGGPLKKATTPNKERSLFICNRLNFRFLVCQPIKTRQTNLFLYSRAAFHATLARVSLHVKAVSHYKGGSNDQNNIFT